MGDRPILCVIHTVTIGAMLNFNIGLNFGQQYRVEFRYVWAKLYIHIYIE